MHDAKGRPLKVGDVVLVPFKIVGVSPTEDMCNVTAETLIGRRPDGKSDTVCTNTGVTLRCNDDGDAELNFVLLGKLIREGDASGMPVSPASFDVV